VNDLFDNDTIERPGAGVPGTPANESFWAYSTRGEGANNLRWDLDEGKWSIVVMNDDASAGIEVAAEAGAEIPALPWVATGLLIGGAVGLGLAALVIVLAVRSASRPKAGTT
jgi:hypothetical protein